MAGTVMSIMVLAIIALLIGAGYLFRRGIYQRRALLMVLLAIIIAVNIALWTIPVSTGESLAKHAPQGPSDTPDGP